MSASPDDEFDRIVEGLDLDLTFEPFDEPVEPVAVPVAQTPDEAPELHDWQVHKDPPALNGARVAGWLAVLGGPALLVAAIVFGQVLPRAVAFAAVIAFVAGAVYLVSQLPDHGPSSSDWPDDGAVL